MLSLRVHLADLASPGWAWARDRWVNGQSWIKPFTHPVLQSALTETGGYVRECRAGGDHVTVKFSPARLRLTAGLFGTAPLYLVARDSTLVGSWNLPDLRSHIRADDLCARAVVRLLTRRHRYSADTVFANVRKLTERAVATFDNAGLNIQYPPPGEHILRAREPRPGIDVVKTFHDLMVNCSAQVPVPADQVGIELSGGIDSANVALTIVALRDDHLRSVGLVVGDGQRERRERIVKHLGLHDTAISASLYPPFGPSRARGHDPARSYYREAFDALRDSASGTSVVFTGLGGDELCALHPEELIAPEHAMALPNWLGPAADVDIEANIAPVSVIPIPTLMAFTLHNPTYLEAGIWPVAPLAHPHIGRFCEQLPMRWRLAKTLLRARLRRAGFGDDVVSPESPESFSGLMQLGLRRGGLSALKEILRESVLIDHRYVDHARLASAYEQAVTARRIPSELADVINLETGLRSLM